jgi:hypothetical protein
VTYVAFVDPSGGAADSMTLAIAHKQAGRIILDCVRERIPPFSPEDVVHEFAALLKPYRVAQVRGDRYAGEWPRDRFRASGITYAVADQPKSDLYRDLLPPLNSGQVELLDLPRLRAQLGGLERRTARGGRDTIDHAPHTHDDLVNAVAGALLLAQRAYVWDFNYEPLPEPDPIAVADAYHSRPLLFRRRPRLSVREWLGRIDA